MNFNIIGDMLQETLFLAKKQACHLNRHILAVTRLPIQAPDFIQLLEKNIEHSTINLWLGKDDYSLIGLGIAHELIAKGENRFAVLSEAWKELISDAVVTGNEGVIAMGGFRFDTDSCHSELWNNFPDAVLIIPSIMICSRSNGTSDLIISNMITSQSNIENRFKEIEEFWHKINSKKEYKQSKSIKHFTIKEDSNLKAQWSNLVHHALEDINQQKLKKVVIARQLHLKADQPISLSHVIHKLRSNNPKACVFAFDRQNSYFVGATPETLFSSRSGFFQTMALAGTAPRGNSAQEDIILGEQLLHNMKDINEHALVMNTIKATLTDLCTDLYIDHSPSLHKLPKVQHLITCFKGKIKSNKNILDIIHCLHPTPAVGGIPKAAAINFLSAYETMDRGWYAGPIGWINSDGDGEFMVALRSGIIHGDNAVLFAGCGIVAGSEAESEFQETELKFSTMLDAIIAKN